MTVVRVRLPDHVYSALKDLNVNISELFRACLYESLICDGKAPERLRNITLAHLDTEKKRLEREIQNIKTQIEALKAQLNQLNIKLQIKEQRLEEIDNLLTFKETFNKVWTYFSMKHEQIQRDIERSFADIEYLLSRDDPDLKSKILARIDAIAQSNNVTSNVVLRLFWEKFRDKYPNLEAILF